METKYYLLFSLYDLQYAIEATLVREIFLLPELTPIAEAPSDIIGILNLRGTVLPVMHLDLRLGHPLQECHLSDSVIVVEWEGLQVGIIVHQVHEVQAIASTAMDTEPDYGRVSAINTAFIAGVARADEDLIVLLNPDTLIRYPDQVTILAWEAQSQGYTELADAANQNDSVEELENELPENGETEQSARVLTNFYDLYCPNAIPEERAIFRQRTENLRQPIITSEVTGQVPLAVVGLNGEYFGLDARQVREFIEIRNLTPIPCCPEHIVGNTNLRGEILTLVDIRRTLNLPLSTKDKATKAMVVQVEDVVAGLTVDDVLEVMYLNASHLTNPPVALPSGGDSFLLGTTPYQEKMLSVLDLPTIFAKGDLVVNKVM